MAINQNNTYPVVATHGGIPLRVHSWTIREHYFSLSSTLRNTLYLIFKCPLFSYTVSTITLKSTLALNDKIPPFFRPSFQTFLPLINLINLKKKKNDYQEKYLKAG